MRSSRRGLWSVLAFGVLAAGLVGVFASNRAGGLLMMKRVKGCGTPPDWAPFPGPSVNSSAGEESPFIAPDGSYLLFWRRNDDHTVTRRLI